MPIRGDVTTISVAFKIKEALERHWNDEEHITWDDYMKDVVKLIEDNEE